MKVDGNNQADAADASVAAGKKTAIPCAITDRHHPFRIGGCRVSSLQSLAHVLCHRARHEQHISMTRGGDEMQTEALEIVKGVVERVDFELTAIARAGIDSADRQAAPEALARLAL